MTLTEARPITQQEALELIRSQRGRFFTATFIKRGDNSIRRMNCRCGVKKHLKGGKAAYDFAANNLIPVFDLTKKEYRSIPADRLIKLEIGGFSLPVIHLPEQPQPEALTDTIQVTFDDGLTFEKKLARVTPGGGIDDCLLLEGGTVGDWLVNHPTFRVQSYRTAKQ